MVMRHAPGVTTGTCILMTPLAYHRTKTHYVIIEGVFVDGLALDDRAAVVDCLIGEEQQSSDVGSIFHAQAYLRECAQLRSECMRGLLNDALLWPQQCVELLNECRIQFQKSLVETMEKRRGIFLGNAC